MVEFSPATQESRVRFPASATFLLRFLFIKFIGCFLAEKCTLVALQGKTKRLVASVSFVSSKVKIRMQRISSYEGDNICLVSN